jgi:hypothetical protein
MSVTPLWITLVVLAGDPRGQSISSADSIEFSRLMPKWNEADVRGGIFNSNSVRG